MAEVIFENRAGGIATGEEELLPPAQKTRKTETETDEFAEENELIEVLAKIADEEAMSEKDYSMAEMASLLNGHKDQEDQWFKFMQSVVDSEGFDMNYIPWDEYKVLPIRPVLNLHPSLNEHAKDAVEHFNKKEHTNYEFVKVVKANIRVWGPGVNLYITFEAVNRNPDAHGLMAFQALVWAGPGPQTFVKFCRPK